MLRDGKRRDRVVERRRVVSGSIVGVVVGREKLRCERDLKMWRDVDRYLLSGSRRCC